MSGDIDSILAQPQITTAHTADPSFPFLISFPRTGSHWLRMIMELYFGRPSLVRIFYFRDAARFTCYHRHDEELVIKRENVLYLYRRPVDTIYSQMSYHHEDPLDADRVAYWATLYARHLHKWLHNETFTRKKTVLTYEGLKRDLPGEFAKVCAHFGVEMDRGKLDDAAAAVTREEVQRRTCHDPRVVDLTKEYTARRERFVRECSRTVMAALERVSPELPLLFGPEISG